MVRKCKVKGCGKNHEARGYCGAHYRNWRRKNNLDPRQSKDYQDAWQRTPAGRWSALKRAARCKGIGFNITREQHSNLILQPCFYCGGGLNPTGHALDRKDNDKGYLLENVVPCCYICNQIKTHILTHEEMVYVSKCLKEFRRGIQ